MGAEDLKPAAEDALRGWLVSKRLNKSGQGDDDDNPSASDQRGGIISIVSRIKAAGTMIPSSTSFSFKPGDAMCSARATKPSNPWLTPKWRR
jgi:hypothetical protein